MVVSLRVCPVYIPQLRIKLRHVQVERDVSRAKFWLDPVRLVDSDGFRGVESTGSPRSCGSTAKSP